MFVPAKVFKQPAVFLPVSVRVSRTVYVRVSRTLGIRANVRVSRTLGNLPIGDLVRARSRPFRRSRRVPCPRFHVSRPFRRSASFASATRCRCTLSMVAIVSSDGKHPPEPSNDANAASTHRSRYVRSAMPRHAAMRSLGFSGFRGFTTHPLRATPKNRASTSSTTSSASALERGAARSASRIALVMRSMRADSASDSRICACIVS